jgi:cation/acetate symporter
MYGGLLVSVVLIIFSPVVSGKPADPVTGKSLSMITDTSVDFHWFPLDNPGLVSIPVAFLLGYLGTITSRERSSREKYAEMEVRSLTGAGAEQAVVH